jgi:tRNA(Ile)-lysidine synthase TilS/MesJ
MTSPREDRRESYRMSNRTIVEFNHDFAARVDTERFNFCNLLMSALRTGDKHAWEALQSTYGLTFIVTGHHTDNLAETARFCLSPAELKEEERLGK